MNTQPTLKGPHLTLRPLKADEFEALFNVASDPLIWEQHPESTRYRREVFQKYFDGAIQSNGALAIIDNQTGKIVGASRYYDLNIQKSEVAIGFTFLARAYWGGKFNREIKRLMLNHAFEFVDTVIFHVGSKNFRSQRALEKIGAQRFTQVGETLHFKLTKSALNNQLLA